MENFSPIKLSKLLNELKLNDLKNHAKILEDTLASNIINNERPQRYIKGNVDSDIWMEKEIENLQIRKLTYLDANDSLNRFHKAESICEKYNYSNGVIIMNRLSEIYKLYIKEIENQVPNGLTLYPNDYLSKESMQQLKDSRLTELNSATWICNSCSEENESLFDCCWKCQKEKKAIETHFFEFNKTSLAPIVSTPKVFKDIGIDNLYDGDVFLKSNYGKFDVHIPLLFRDQKEDLNFIIIGTDNISYAKKIIDFVIQKNHGLSSFNKLEDKDGWEYVFENKSFRIGFYMKTTIRINLINHNINPSILSRYWKDKN